MTHVTPLKGGVTHVTLSPCVTCLEVVTLCSDVTLGSNDRNFLGIFHFLRQAAPCHADQPNLVPVLTDAIEL